MRKVEREGREGARMGRIVPSSSSVTFGCVELNGAAVILAISCAPESDKREAEKSRGGVVKLRDAGAGLGTDARAETCKAEGVEESEKDLRSIRSASGGKGRFEPGLGVPGSDGTRKRSIQHIA